MASKKDYNKEEFELGRSVLKNYIKRTHMLNCLKIEQSRRCFARPCDILALKPIGHSAFAGLSDEELSRCVAYVTYDVMLCDHALQTLESDVKNLAVDIYVHGLSWAGASLKYHLSESAICRRLQRAAAELGKVLMPGVTTLNDLNQEIYGVANER